MSTTVSGYVIAFKLPLRSLLSAKISIFFMDYWDESG